MFLFKKEKEVVELLLKHMDVVETCLTTGIKTIQTYFKGDTRDAKSWPSRSIRSKRMRT